MLKSNLTIFSESPRYFEVNEDEDTLKKEVLHSVATALANIVLPVPGGPTIKTPFKGRRMPKIQVVCLVMQLFQLFKYDKKSISLFFFEYRVSHKVLSK